MFKLRNVDPADETHARIARAAAVALFVVGITALIVLPQGSDSPALPSTIGEASPVFLHAPATDPSLPSAESVFSPSSRDDEPTTPTF